jgi:serine/threonine protein kinase
MAETKSPSENEGTQPPAEGLSGSSPETKSQSGAEDSQQPGEDSQESFSLLHPTKLGHYVILRRLGKGGFGEVFLAFDEELDRPVAIKVPHRERITQPEDIEAYLNEARILASLDHPHSVLPAESSGIVSGTGSNWRGPVASPVRGGMLGGGRSDRGRTKRQRVLPYHLLD